MDLREFVKATLVEIVGGVQDARDEIEREGSNAYVAPIVRDSERNDLTSVAFDVAVTATETADGKAEAGIKVWALRLGASGGVSSGSESVSRIQFAVPVMLPGKVPEEDRQARAKAAAEREAENARIAAHNRISDTRI